MSLRMFHLFFITMSVLMAVFAAAWATGEYRQTGDATYLVGTVSALAGAGGLAVYGTMFQRKTRNL
jgi:hypothetical protein